jgi:hypothetical protein
VPGTQDPLLLHWFGEQLPWLLRDVQELPEALADLGHVHPLTTLPVDHEAIAGFAPPPDKDAGTTAAIATAAGTATSAPPAPDRAQLAEAQAALLSVIRGRVSPNPPQPSLTLALTLTLTLTLTPPLNRRPLTLTPPLK